MAKLDCLLARLTMMDNRPDSHDCQITRAKKFNMGNDREMDEGGADKTPSASPRRLLRGGNGDNAGYWRSRYYCDNYNNDSHGLHPCHTELKFPRYNGETNLLPWLNKHDNFFRGHRTLEKAWMASLHLDGTTGEWYYYNQMEYDFGMVSWLRFVKYVNLCFGPPIRSNALHEIKAIQCTGASSLPYCAAVRTSHRKIRLILSPLV